jgi:putative transposase
MNAPKVDELDYIQFLIAAQRVFTCTKAAACQPEQLDPPAHDAVRLVRELAP